MTGNVLVTGTSGYLGGSLCSQLCRLGVPDLKIFALVRSASQHGLVRQMGAEPLTFDAYDQSSVSKAVRENAINIVYYLIDYTTGTKQFGKHAGAPTDQPLFDTDPNLYDIQKSQESPHSCSRGSVAANCEVIEEGERTGVCVYLFSPCMVYGEGKGFGNRISIQVVDIVKAALAAGKVYNPNPGSDELWPVCHLDDTINLYVKLLWAITNNQHPAHGKNSYYLASSGQIAWADVYSAFARALAKRGLVQDANVARPDKPALKKMAAALGCQPAFVPVWIGGHCTYTAKHGHDLGWSPQYSSSHLFEVADEEVEFILNQLKK